MNALTKIVLSLAVAAACFGQNATPTPAPEPKYFKLEFTVKELDGGKVVSSRKYVMSIMTGHESSSVRSGNRIPVRSGVSPNTYVEVGVNIDCHGAKEIPNGLALSVTGDISTAVPLPEGMTGSPAIRNNKWSSIVVVRLNKAVTIFSSDDPTTNHQMQVELLATPIV